MGNAVTAQDRRFHAFHRHRAPSGIPGRHPRTRGCLAQGTLTASPRASHRSEATLGAFGSL